MLLWGLLFLLANGVPAFSQETTQTEQPTTTKAPCPGVDTRLGCFPMGARWFSENRPLPAPRDPVLVNTSMRLSTRSAPEPRDIPLWPEVVLEPAEFHTEARTVFVVHGSLSERDAHWPIRMKDALLGKIDGNVILVHWGDLSDNVSFVQLASDTRVVAAEMTRVCHHLLDHFGVRAAQIHIIGHGLGAHIAGYVGKNIPGLKRITALDATQPAFEGHSSAVRVIKGDAEFIDVLHTNGRSFFHSPKMGLGCVLAFGDVDFFARNGAEQPGCLGDGLPYQVTSVAQLANVTKRELMVGMGCHHYRAVDYFTAALETKVCIFAGRLTLRMIRLLGLSIPDYMDYKEIVRRDKYTSMCPPHMCNVMGLQTPDMPARGEFSLAVSQSYPYCIAYDKRSCIYPI